MEKVCDPIFAKKLTAPTEGCAYPNYNHKPNRPWFDEECQVLRDHFYRELNIYRENKSNINEKNMINARSNFKNLIRKQEKV